MESIRHYDLPADDERTVLREGIIRALRAVPMHFKSPINIEGISATDLFAINTLLGGAIEDQTVAALNEMREIWDPDRRWADYEFRRYAESFPDVRLESEESPVPLIGIELKGWYLLAKEEAPSFRFRASADAMTVWDLIAVFPWSLSNVISGKPLLYAPFVEQAKYAADMRTYYWEHRSKDAQKVTHPHTYPYPAAGSSYSDVAEDDKGGNFGRIARISGLMDEWLETTKKTPLAGIEVQWWMRFLKMFNERGDAESIRKGLEKLAKETKHDSQWADELMGLVQRLMEM